MPPRQKPLYSSGIPRAFLVYGKLATAIEIVILTVFQYLFTISVTAWPDRDEQTTSEMHRFSWEGPNSVEMFWEERLTDVN